MPSKIFSHIMKDGSRNFVDLPETVFFDELREIVQSLKEAVETGFVTDWVTEVWLDFESREHKFSINNQHGNYWFFVDDPDCPDEILMEVAEHFRKFLEK